MTFLKKLDKEGVVQYIDANKKKQTKSLQSKSIDFQMSNLSRTIGINSTKKNYCQTRAL